MEILTSLMSLLLFSKETLCAFLPHHRPCLDYVPRKVQYKNLELNFLLTNQTSRLYLPAKITGGDCAGELAVATS